MILFHMFKGICTSAFLNFRLCAWPLVLVLRNNWPVVAVFCLTQSEERSLSCKVHVIKISLDVSDNAPFLFIMNITFILTEQEETFRETSRLICISAFKKRKRDIVKIFNRLSGKCLI